MRRTLAALVLLECALAFWLIADRRMVRGHDAFQYFSLQHYFLNGAATAGEVPQWMPTLTHGTVANWWYAVQASPLQQVLLLAAPLLKWCDGLTLFHLGLLFDHLLFVTGAWLLGRRLTGSEWSAAFTALAAATSTVSMDQPWFNLHYVYALPLILFGLHRFLDTGHWGYAALAGNLLGVQTMGNLPYLFPVTTLILAVYAAVLLAVQGRGRTGVRAAGIGLAAAALPLGLAYAFSTLGTDSIANHNYGRLPDGTVPLEAFLTYSDNTDLAKWREMILGVSPCRDYTLYAGILTAPLALMGLLLRPWRETLPAAATAVAALLVSSGTFVAVLAFEYWPMMKYYRHLALMAPLIKLFTCLLAGFGFEALFVRRTGLRAAAVVLALLTIVIPFIEPAVVGHGLPKALEMSETRVPTTALFAGAAALLAGLGGRWKALPLAALALQAGDVGLYRVDATRRKTFVPTAEATRFSPVTYVPRRLQLKHGERTTREYLMARPRATAVADFDERYGTQYWSIDAFLNVDQLGTAYRVDHWLIPLDKYIKAYTKQEIENLAEFPAGFLPYAGLEFPKAGALIAGSEEKARVVASARFLDERETVMAMRAPEYDGETIFVDGDAGPAGVSGACRVTRFEANVAEFEAEGPGWLLYSDVWHPGWRAAVNGAETPVRRANLAYKAVALPPGPCAVHFEFSIRGLTAIQTLLALNALAWVAGLPWLVWRFTRES